MPDVRNCRRCGKIFNYIGGAPICSACKQDDEEDFKRVKQYLYENPGAIITCVSADLNISMEKIKRFLKDGRLEIKSTDGNMVLECENCGRAITTGRFCSECEKDLANGFKSVASQMKNDLESFSDSSKKQVGLRYLNKDFKKDFKE